MQVRAVTAKVRRISFRTSFATRALSSRRRKNIFVRSPQGNGWVEIPKGMGENSVRQFMLTVVVTQLLQPSHEARVH